MMFRTASAASLFVSLLLAAGSGEAGEIAPAFKIYVEHSAVYQVSFERLEAAGIGAMLVGESLLASDDPSAAAAALLG